MSANQPATWAMAISGFKYRHGYCVQPVVDDEGGIER